MATSIIKLHVFSGAGDGSPPCYLLQVDEFHCLLDCGWCDDLSSDYVKAVAKCAKHIDAVLLSHQSMRHLGLLPYLVGTCGLNCPIYATTPIYKMGQMFLYDFYQSRHATEDFMHFSLDDVDAAFDLITQVKYQQTINLHGRGHGLCVTPLPSGHTLGGTIWKLVKEDTDIVYALDFNHKKERHLNGATFDACMRPHLLILDASNALHTQPRRKDRDENLRQIVLKTVRRGGNVLVAVDTAGRCLEIAHFLEQSWLNQESGLMAYGLAMLTYVAVNVVDFAKSMVEWMSEKVMRTFEDQRNNPFHFRHMQLCHTIEQLDAVPEPKVVLSSLSDLSCGFARQLFAEWADNDLNTVILTSRDSVVSTPVSSAESQTPHNDLLSRLIGLAKHDPLARRDLPTSSTGTLILPLTLSQRVSASYFDRAEHEIPRLKNAVQNKTTSDNLPGTTIETDSILDIIEKPPAISEDSEDVPMLPSEPLDPTDSANMSPSQNKSTTQSDKTDNLNITISSDKESGQVSPHASRTALFALSMGIPVTDTPKKLSTPNNLLASQISLLNANNANAAIRSISTALDVLANLGGHLTIGRHQAGYDIYPGIHNQAGGQFFRMTKRTQLLFPQLEKKIHWDEYGAHLDRDLFDTPESATNHATWENKGKETRQIVDAVQPVLQATSILDYLAARTPHLDALDSNTKCITHQLEIPLRCELVFLDYEGKSDGEAVKRIVVGLRPQELILVGQNKEAINHLANHCRNAMLLNPNLIHTPTPNSVVNCTKEGDIYQARMKDSLVSSLKFTRIRDYELAWVEATISLEDKSTTKDSSSSDIDMRPQAVDSLATVGRTPLAADQLPVLNLPTGPLDSHKTVFVNEPKLSDLKQLLLSQGLVAEFMSGVLVVDNCVAIKRSQAGKLILEGLLSGTYFEVRRILYQQFAIL